MADSIVNNKAFRALLTRKNGATGRELADFTGRTFVYSTWSLRCMETETKELWTQKDGAETRYMLKNRAPVTAPAKSAKKPANINARAKSTKPAANGNHKLPAAAALEMTPPAKKV